MQGVYTVAAAPNPRSWQLYCGDQLCRTLPKALGRRVGIQHPGVVDGPALFAALAAEEPAFIRQKALDLLARRDYAAAELTRRLRSDGLDAELVAALVQKLQNAGLVNDERYVANRLAAMQQAGKGRRLAEAELHARGLSSKAIRDAQEQAGYDEAQAAAAALRTLAGRYKNRPAAERTRLLSAAMARRGFGWDTIRTTLADAGLDQADDEDNGWAENV